MRQNKERVRLLHASDIHLVNGGPGRDDTPRRALTALVDLSVAAQADLVIIAGDLFDHNRVGEETVRFVAHELRRATVAVLILPGNHDCLVPDSVYRRAHFPALAPNVRVFTAPQGETFCFPELDVAAWGKPVLDYGGDLRPLAGVPPRGGERWQVAVAHGYYVDSQADPGRSLLIRDEDITASGRDYVALGHRGDPCCISDGAVKTYYSGPDTVMLVDLDGSGVRVTPHRLTV